MRYLNRKILVWAVVALIAAVGFVIYRSAFDFGYLEISVSEPASVTVLAIDNQQEAQALGTISETTTLKLRRGYYVVESFNENGATTISSHQITNRGETVSSNIEFAEPKAAVIASGFSAGSLSPIDVESRQLLATDASSGSLQRLGSNSQTQVSPFLSKTLAVSYSSNHSGLLVTKDRTVYFFDTQKRPISTEVTASLRQGPIQLMYDASTSKFIALDSHTLYSFNPGEQALSLVAELDKLSSGESYDLAVNGDTALILGIASSGGEEGIVVSQQRLDSFVVDLKSGDVRTLEDVSGHFAVVSPDGKLVGIDRGGYVDWLDSTSLERQFVMGGLVGDCSWTSNTILLCGRSGGVFEFDLTKRELRKIVSVAAGTPANIRATPDGNFYFTNTNGRELVIYRSAPSLSNPLQGSETTFPVRTLEFKIDVNYLFGSKPTLVITTFAVINNPSRDATSFATQTSNLRKKALQYLKDQDVDVSAFTIVYSP